MNNTKTLNIKKRAPDISNALKIKTQQHNFAQMSCLLLFCVPKLIMTFRTQIHFTFRIYCFSNVNLNFLSAFGTSYYTHTLKVLSYLTVTDYLSIRKISNYDQVILLSSNNTWSSSTHFLPALRNRNTAV